MPRPSGQQSGPRRVARHAAPACGRVVVDVDAWHAVPAQDAARFYRTLRELR
jgi:hypothetical protein